jgi:hypothetical protein
MRKAYKWLIGMTTGVILISILILILQGRSSQMTNTPLYIAHYALFNIYLYLVAFLYSPSFSTEYKGIFDMIKGVFKGDEVTEHQNTDGHNNSNTKRSEDERDNFMDKFYE